MASATPWQMRDTKVADAVRPPAALEHALDVMRSRSASLKLEHVPASNNGRALRASGEILSMAASGS